MKPLVGIVMLGSALFAGSLLAQSPGGYGPYGPLPYPNPMARYQPVESPATVLRGGIDKLLKFLHQEERPDTKTLSSFLENDIAPYFDFTYMAEWAAGASWAQMTEKQQVTLASSVEERFLATLAEQLKDYDRQAIRFLRPRRQGSEEVSVTVGLLNPGRYPSKLEFRMYRSPQGGWKVFDVVANGQSAAAYYRQDFNQRTRQQLGLPPRG